MVLLWFLASYPRRRPGATGPAIRYSFAGMLGRGLETIFTPLGFNWQISVALVPGIAAREVVVGALGTVYSLSAAPRATCDEALRPDDRHELESGHGAVAAGLVCVCAAMPVDARDGAARDQLLALSADHDRLSVRDGLCRGVRDLPHRHGHEQRGA